LDLLSGFKARWELKVTNRGQVKQGKVKEFVKKIWDLHVS